MEDEASAATEDGEGAKSGPHTRIDWRTGRPMVFLDTAFWKEHEARRVEQGLSVPAYCKANDLALSTFRRYAAQETAESRPVNARKQTAAQPSRFVPIGGTTTSDEAPVVEIETGEGMKLRLLGPAADRLMQHVLGKLA